jgi:hypothetical protein
MKFFVFETLSVFKRLKLGEVLAIVEKINDVEYQTMHSLYQTTPSLDKEHCDESLCVALTIHC